MYKQVIKLVEALRFWATEVFPEAFNYHFKQLNGQSEKITTEDFHLNLELWPPAELISAAGFKMEDLGTMPGDWLKTMEKYGDYSTPKNRSKNKAKEEQREAKE